tara:strand:- start:449 stop:910 length:462 start_codon:yes stop_codon:yes gene_type:complete
LNHVPKTGGNSIINPFVHAIGFLKKAYAKQIDNEMSKFMLAHARPFLFASVSSNHESQGLEDLLISRPALHERQVFISAHNANWMALRNILQASFSHECISLGVYRDPKKRLRAGVAHLLRKCRGDVKQVLSLIKARDIHLDNSIYQLFFLWG